MAYHMRRKDREIKDPSVIEAVIGAGRFAVCALCVGNEPYAVTLSYGYDKRANRLYFHCAAEGRKIDMLRKNPNVCLSIIEDNGYIEHECSHAYRTVVIRGRMEFISDEEERLHAIRVFIEHFEKEPGRMAGKIDSKSEEWKRTCMLRLAIDHSSCKERKRKAAGS